MMPLKFSPKYELGQVLYYEAISQDEMATAVISRFVCVGITVVDTPNSIPADITSAPEPYYDTEYNFEPHYVYSGFDQTTKRGLMFTESEVFESPKALAKALSEKAEASYDTEIERIEKLLENFFESQKIK